MGTRAAPRPMLCLANARVAQRFAGAPCALPLHVRQPARLRAATPHCAPLHMRVICSAAAGNSDATVSVEEAQKSAALGYKKRAEESAAAGMRQSMHHALYMCIYKMLGTFYACG